MQSRETFYTMPFGHSLAVAGSSCAMAATQCFTYIIVLCDLLPLSRKTTLFPKQAEMRQLLVFPIQSPFSYSLITRMSMLTNKELYSIVSQRTREPSGFDFQVKL